MATNPTLASGTPRDRKEEFYRALKIGDVGAARDCLEAIRVLDGGVGASGIWCPTWMLVNAPLG